MKEKHNTFIPDESLINKIYLIREQKVMIDSDLAELYAVETKVLNQAVSRNIERFPSDFMFELNAPEWSDLKSQFVTSSWGGRRKLPKGSLRYPFENLEVTPKLNLKDFPKLRQI